MIKFAPFLFLCLVTQSLWAAIPKSSFILQKTVENHGQGTYQIEQEVQFSLAQENVVLKETWLIENENSMQLTVSGTREWKDQIQMTFRYANGTKTTDGKSQDLSSEMFERYFHFRSVENFARQLIQLELVPKNVLDKLFFRSLKDVNYPAENFVRLSRSGGVINYAFGKPSGAGLWIEQDQFVIRKIKFPSGAEVVADRYNTYAKNLNYPRVRTLHWGQNTVTLQTISVGSRPGASMTAKSTTNNLSLLKRLSSASVIEDFYSRFR